MPLELMLLNITFCMYVDSEMTLRPERLSFDFLNMPEVDKLLVTPEKKEMRDTNEFFPFKIV